MPSPDPDHYRMSFGAHLDELRRRVLRALIAPVLVAIPAFIFGDRILIWLLKPLIQALESADIHPSLQVLSPAEVFMTYFKTALVAAVIVAGPAIVYQLWKFIEPGLYSREKRFVYLLVPGSAFLAVAGSLFVYYAALPAALHFFIGFGLKVGDSDILGNWNKAKDTPLVEPAPGEILPQFPMLDDDPPNWEPGQAYFNQRFNELRFRKNDSEILTVPLQRHSLISQEFQLRTYLGFVALLMGAFALAFQMPLVLLLLGWIGVVSPAFLRKNRKYAIFGITIVGAVLTPPDAVSLALLALPLAFLYELSIWLLILLPARRVAGSSDEH